MDTFTEIQYLFCSTEHENKSNAWKMERLREITTQSSTKSYSNGYKTGVMDCRSMLNEKLILLATKQ